MEDFQKLFYEEAQDFISNLEEILLLLEDDHKNIEHLNEVFRIMHSLKGSGAMFGYNNLSSFTHELESLYDQIRDDKIKLSPIIINFTIGAIDHIKELLENKNSPELIEKTNEKTAHLNKILQNESTYKQTPSPQTDTKKEPIAINTNMRNKVYYVRFEPNEDIFNDGTNPLYLIDELVDLGDSIVKLYSGNIPDINEINPEKCYLSWIIILSTDVSLSTINDVFIFVEDDSNIIIELLSEMDLFSINNTKSTFEYLLNNKPNDIESFIKYTETQENELKLSEDISPVKELHLLNNDTTVQEAIDNSHTKEEIKLPEALNIETVKVSAKKLDSLINLVSELVTTQARLLTLANKSNSVELTGLSEGFQHLSRQFREIAFDMRLIPIQTMLVKFKRLIRDLSKKLDKKVKFITEGTETELDKNIIATLSDPIMHIIRNAIDHGIESHEIRIKNNKPETGIIKLKAEYSGTAVLITIEDDGAGIDTDKVLQKAIKNNFVEATDELTDDEIFNLLLLPGFSTSDSVTDVSGRGVGMDVVRKKIDELRGEVSISSKLGEGTQIQIRLPLTLSIIDGLLVSINQNKFVIQMASVKQIYRVNREKIQNSYNDIIDIEGAQFPFIDLTEKFENSGSEEEQLHFVSVSYHKKNVGIIINELISEYQAVLKPIGNIMQNNEIFAGATILGDGKVALVLDTNKVIDFYTN